MTIKSFWNWFSDNQERLFNFDDKNAEKTMKEIHRNLCEVKNDLGIEVSKVISGKRQMEISAEGDIEKFDKVKQIVAEAPLLDKWKIIAFRQASLNGFILKFDEIELNTSKLFFLPVEEDGELDIVIFGEEFNQCDAKKLTHYGFIMMDNLLGEYDSVIKVRHYDFEDLSTVEDKEQLHPLEELSEFLDWFYSTESE